MTECVFNDESFLENYPDSEYSARNLITGFVETVAAVIRECGVRPLLRSERGLDELVFRFGAGKTYGFSSWRGDRAVDMETRIFFNGLDSMVPAAAGVSTETEAALLEEEYAVADPGAEASWAVAVALVGGHVMTSLLTDAKWNCSVLSVFQRGAAAALGGVGVDSYEVMHASRPEHAEEISRRFQRDIVGDFRRGGDFENMCGKAFPLLCFSPDVFVQMRGLESGTLQQAVERLVRMNETARVWREDGDIAYLFAWAPESEATRGNPELMAARRFRHPDGGTAVFEWHTRVSRRHRIHFIEDRESKTFIIGYVGDHLPTVLHGT